MIINNLQSLRGIAILMVLCLHLYGAERLYGSANFILPEFCNLGVFGVDLFFVISGFIMATITRGKFGKFSYICRFLNSRFLRIFPLYWLCSTVFLLSLIIFDVGDPERLQNLNIFKSFLLLPQEQYPILVVGWTLVHELYFYVAFAVILLFPEKYFTIALVVWTTAVVFAGVLIATMSLQMGATLELVLHPLTLEFIAGCILAKIIHNGFIKYGLSSIILGTALLIVIYIFSGIEHYPTGWMRLLCFGPPAALIVYGSISIEFSHSVILPSFLQVIGNISYSMYLIHVPLILVFSLAWSKTGRLNVFDNILALTLIFFIVFAASVLCYKIVEQPMQRLKKIMEKY